MDDHLRDMIAAFVTALSMITPVGDFINEVGGQAEVISAVAVIYLTVRLVVHRIVPPLAVIYLTVRLVVHRIVPPLLGR